MKKIIGLSLLFVLILACAKEKVATPEHQLYVFATEKKICQNFWQDNLTEFSELFDCEISWKIFAEPSEMYAEYARLDSVQKHPDLILGLDEVAAARAKTDSVFAKADLNNLNKLNSRLKTKEDKLIPLFYSSLGFLYNKAAITDHPQSFGEIQDGVWQKQLLMSHPLHSALGKSFLTWSIAAFGRNGYGHFWRSMKDNIFSAPPDWDTAADMFLAEQANILFIPSSYYAYFLQLHSEEKYGLFVPAEGSYLYQEYGGVLLDSAHKKIAFDLLNYLISENFQAEAASQRYLLPSNKNIKHKLPLPQNNKIFRLQYSDQQLAQNIDRWSKRWERLTQ